MTFKIQTRLGEFFDQDERGSMSVEAVLIFPMLLWMTVAAFTFFDSYKSAYSAQRANATISDLLSRETDDITQDYLDGMHRAFRFLTAADSENSWMRVTVVDCNSSCSDSGRDLEISWTETVNGARDLSASDLIFYDDKIPFFAQSDQVIMVETSVQYVPRFPQIVAGIPQTDLQHLVINRPRFAPKLDWDNG